MGDKEREREETTFGQQQLTQLRKIKLKKKNVLGVCLSFQVTIPSKRAININVLEPFLRSGARQTKQGAS